MVSTNALSSASVLCSSRQVKVFFFRSAIYVLILYLWFEFLFHYWNKELTLKGHTVYSLAVFPSQEKNKNWYNNEQKQTLDLIHLDKILNSDAIVVLNQDGYVGESTRKEIEWAKIKNKQIYYTYQNHVDYKCATDLIK